MFSDPKSNLEQFGLDKGYVVADLGAGSGFYSVEAAKMVAPTGHVYAVDIQKGLLTRIKSEAKQARLASIEVIAGDLEKLGGTKLKEASIDRVVASNILFQIESKKDFVTEIRRILKPHGLVLVIDWKASYGNMGPHEDAVVYKDDCMRLFKEAQFTFVREIDPGDHHYGMIFRR